MRVRGPAIALLALAPISAVAAGPVTTTVPTTVPTTAPALVPATATVAGHPPFAAGAMTMTAATARVWDQGSLSVAELHGPVRIELGTATLTADDAVVFLKPAGAGGRRPVDVVLLGHVELAQAGIVFSYDRYWVPAEVTGAIRLVGQRSAEDDHGSATYRAAAALLREQRPAAVRFATTAAAAAAATTGPTTGRTAGPGAAASGPVPLPPVVPAAAASPPPPLPVRLLNFSAKALHRERAADGTLALVCTGGVSFNYLDAKQNLLEFSAENMVLFTDLKSARDATGGSGGGGDVAGSETDHVTSGYFEGDVRVFTTPANGSRNELRMRAGRCYYEFATDRAVLSDVVFHTVDARKGVPVFMRAAAVRQLSQGEFKADGVEMTTSAFATPSFGLGASHIYVRGEDSGDPRVGERVTYQADDVTLNAFGVPFFYDPSASGTMTARGSVFRGVGLEDGNQFGFGFRSTWGLFETLNQPVPEHVDADYNLDYFSSRGPAAGLNVSYNGGTITDDARQPYNLAGDLHAFFVDDHGTDVLGADRNNERAPEELRGRVYYEHEQDFGTNWTAQVRLGYDSDSNFLPQYFNGEYQNGLPIDESLYLKHVDGPELASVLAEWQPNRAVTTADAEQENREVSHLPELTYDRVGDSLLGDRLTSFTVASADGDKFVRSDLSLRQQGFFDVVKYPQPSEFAYPIDPGHPGLPAYAYTGDPGNTTYRGDLRQEVDFPVNLGVVHVVPYAMGRYTGYNQGVAAFEPVVPPRGQTAERTVPDLLAKTSGENRLIGGGGVRLTTDLWRVDDAVESDLFDLHRLRHVVTPEVNLFASGQTVDQNRLFIYDPAVDALNDVQAAQVALRQRWQTKRGGPGKWRSVDVLTVDVYANLFANQPGVRYRDPPDFRSTFLQAEPEYSLPRNTANAEATWRVSDTTAVLAGVVQNLDGHRLATANIGVAVTRDQRLSYFLGTRYIADLDSNVATFDATYQLDRKYSLSASESVDLAQSRNVYYQATLNRRFDTFTVSVDAHYDQSTNDEGFGFNVSPNGIARGLNSGQLVQPQP